jgi:hypothetical protein
VGREDGTKDLNVEEKTQQYQQRQEDLQVSTERIAISSRIIDNYDFVTFEERRLHQFDELVGIVEILALNKKI